MGELLDLEPVLRDAVVLAVDTGACARLPEAAPAACSGDMTRIGYTQPSRRKSANSPSSADFSANAARQPAYFTRKPVVIAATAVGRPACGGFRAKRK